MGVLGISILVVGAMCIGGVAMHMSDEHAKYEWVPAAIGAAIGGYLASILTSGQTWGSAIDGLYIGPALLGAIVLGGVVDAVVHFGAIATHTLSHQ